MGAISARRLSGVQRAAVSGRLALRVLPWVALAAITKLVLDALDAEPIAANPLLSGIVAANVFLLGFLLAGTLADFKESEKLPGELAGSVEAMADECLCVREAKGDPIAEDCLLALRDLCTRVREWLGESCAHDEVLDAVTDLNPHLLALESVTQATFVNRLKQEQAAIRKMLVRMNVIRQTTFVTAGYVIAGLTAWLVVIGLLLTDTDPPGEAVFFVSVITFLLVYMNKLIRDLDNPFEYRRGRQGAADVSVAPIEAVEGRLDALIEQRPAPLGGEPVPA